MKISFILVEPARAENIGAAARAIKTMGFNSLRLVNAEVTEPAYWVAHESDDILKRAGHFATLKEALADVDFSIGTTARRRLQKDDYLTPGECALAFHGKRQSVAHAALVFGRESSGLTGRELACCDAATTIPLKVTQPSLNLSQAVMLYAWELSRPAPVAGDNGAPANYAVTRQYLADTLDRLGVRDHPNLSRWAMEGLGRCNARDLGMLMQLLRRIP